LTVTGRGIWTPGPEEGFDFTTDLGVMAESIDLAIGEVEAGANFYRGTVSERNAFLSQAQEGDAWMDTNGDRFLWVKRGTVWVRERLTDDTGWKTIPLLPSYVAHQGTPMYRILNDVLYLKGTLRRTSGNMPNSGQTTISHPIPDLTARGFSGDSYDPALCVGPTGGTLLRVYLSEDNELRYGGSAGYGTGVASYVSLAGASGVWTV